MTKWELLEVPLRAKGKTVGISFIERNEVPAMTMLALNNISTRYGEFQALTEFHLTIRTLRPPASGFGGGAEMTEKRFESLQR